jgi:protein-disulfide isomerase
MRRSFTKPALAIALLAAFAACRSKEVPKETHEAVEHESPAAGRSAVQDTIASEPEEPSKTIVEAAPGELDPRVLYQVPLRGDEPQDGPDGALITIVEFGDFDCPFCKERAPTLTQLRDKYGNDLRVIWLNYPIPSHRNARPAASAALEALAQKGDAGFWKMHDKLFENQGNLNRQTLERLAKELGLDMKKFREALDNDKYAERLDREYALGQKLNIPGTPSYFMNGRFMAGFPLQTWSFAIDQRIGAVRRAVESGVPRSDIYETITAQGKPSP